MRPGRLPLRTLAPALLLAYLRPVEARSSGPGASPSRVNPMTRPVPFTCRVQRSR
jgi:hypothetical protein